MNVIKNSQTERERDKVLLNKRINIKYVYAAICGCIKLVSSEKEWEERNSKK